MLGKKKKQDVEHLVVIEFGDASLKSTRHLVCIVDTADAKVATESAMDSVSKMIEDRYTLDAPTFSVHRVARLVDGKPINPGNAAPLVGLRYLDGLEGVILVSPPTKKAKEPYALPSDHPVEDMFSKESLKQLKGGKASNVLPLPKPKNKPTQKTKPKVKATATNKKNKAKGARRVKPAGNTSYANYADSRFDKDNPLSALAEENTHKVY